MNPLLSYGIIYPAGGLGPARSPVMAGTICPKRQCSGPTPEAWPRGPEHEFPRFAEDVPISEAIVQLWPVLAEDARARAPKRRF